jgi:hypothetical protein
MTRPKRHYRGMTAEAVREIRRKYFAREANQRQLGEQYQRAQHTISRIVSAVTWSHVA